MKKRLLSLFLCAVMVFGFVPGLAAAAKDTGFNIYCGGDRVSAVELPENGAVPVEALLSESAAGSFQWQIRVSKDVWANIVGSGSNELTLRFAMLANLLNEDGQATVRCRFTPVDGKAIYTNELTVQMVSDYALMTLEADEDSPFTFTVLDPGSVVIHDTAEKPEEPEETPAPTATPAPEASAAPTEEPAAPSEEPAEESAAPAEESAAPSEEPAAPAEESAAPTEEAAVPVEETAAEAETFSLASFLGLDSFGLKAYADEGEIAPDEKSTYTVVINYESVNGQVVASPYVATLAAGSAFSATVTFPTVQGYLPYIDGVQKSSLDINIASASNDVTYTVVYKPAIVNYTVIHYQQNIDNDNYSEVDRVTKTGYTEAAVGEELANTYTGFYSLLYDTTTKIAADGSTVVEIYYDRYYYLMSFDLDGGYGVEPIYARYGAPISIGTPAKAGYTFTSWDKEIPTTMPAANSSYKAQWQAGDAAKVTIVVWGENADDEEYSFYHNDEIMAKPGEKLTLDSLQGKIICGKEEHTHSDSCGIICDHTHSLTCYGLSANASSTSPDSNTAWWCDSKPESYFAQLGLEDGYLYYDDENASLAGKDNYYFRFDGKYYELTASQFNKLRGTEVGKTSDNTRGNPDFYYKYSINPSGMSCNHTHDDSCYACGKPEHTHSSACYFNTSFMENPNLWKLVRSDEVTVAADGTTIINVYYDRVEFTLHFRRANSNSDNYGTIKEKWGADIRDQFNAMSQMAETSDWSENKNAGGPWTSYLDIMPEKDMTFYAHKASGTSTAYYYVEGLDGKDELYYENVSTGTGYTVTVEEFIDIEGFTFNASRSTKVGDKFNGAKFYYTRNSYTLKFFNRTEELTDKAKTVKYEAPLSGYDFVPDYPSDLEPNAYVFAGWYTTAGCYDGSEAHLNTMTMPASDMILYAKWAPKTHIVKTYLTKDAMDNAEDALNTWNAVPHGTAATPKAETPTNGEYSFVGWFYTGDDGKEKAFDFSMPVNRDLNLYAKWSSNKLVAYTIRYTLEDGTEIAAPTTGSALAGSTKTFDAKTGAELNEGYQSGYFPKTSSHSLTINIEGGNEFTFIYVPKAEVNYTVRYLEKGTNNVLHEEKHAATRNAVITEKFEQIAGYAPDAYQKRLVLSADDDQNVITFWYVKDDVHAPVQIIHWTQNIAGDGYTEYQSSTDLNGVIGQTYTENSLTISGFKYNEVKSNPSGTLTAAGLVLNLYYDLIEYPYEFRFMEQGTNNALASAETGKARFGAQVTQTAKTIPGYKLVSSENQAINIAVEDPADVASKNVKTFYYVEDTVDIKYQVVGPTGSGTLDNYQDNGIGVIKGTVKGSAPTAASGYRFVGWFKDEACTLPVDAAWVNADSKLTPGKTKNYGTEASPVMGYEAATYYAKFEYDVADLTIVKTGCSESDLNQAFIFTVTGPDNYSNQVVIKGNGSVTIKGLKIGAYTIREESGWSWRYSCDDKTVELVGGAAMTNSVTMENTRGNDKWLDGNASADNVFKGSN